jgi:hypothetical protein
MDAISFGGIKPIIPKPSPIPTPSQPKIFSTVAVNNSNSSGVLRVDSGNQLGAFQKDEPSSATVRASKVINLKDIRSNRSRKEGKDVDNFGESPKYENDKSRQQKPKSNCSLLIQSQ